MTTEILDAFGQLTREKALDKSEVLDLVQAGMLAAVRRTYGPEANADILVDPASGEIDIYLLKEVVATEEDLEDPSRQMTVAEAKELPYVNEPWGEGDPEPGQIAEIPLDFKDFGRNAIQAAKQMIIQKVREEERERIREEYADRVGELVSGSVQQVDRGNALVFLDRQTEALLPAREQVRREYLRQGETIRALLLDIRETNKGPQLILSRSHPDFVKALFALEVPEVFQGIVEIRAIAREAGSRSKIAVWSRDQHVDPVGACVGLKGSRVQAVVSELGGERIDIVPWTDEPRQFIAQALSPADVYKIILHEPEGVDTGGLFGDPFKSARDYRSRRFRGPTAAPAPFQPASPEETEAALEASKAAREEAARREADRHDAEASEDVEALEVEEPREDEETEGVEPAAEGEDADETAAIEEAEAADEADTEEDAADEAAAEAEVEKDVEKDETEEVEEVPAIEPSPREKRATVVCAEDQLSLAIGRSGQNVRLASKLTGYKIDLVGKQEYLAKEEEILFGRKPEAETETVPVAEAGEADFALVEVAGIDEPVAKALSTAGFRTFNDIIDLEREDLLGVEGVDEEAADVLMGVIDELTVEVDEEWDEEVGEYVPADDSLEESPDVTEEEEDADEDEDEEEPLDRPEPVIEEEQEPPETVPSEEPEGEDDDERA